MNIELEITLRCNHKCPSCSRHCNHVKYENSTDMTMIQIDKFIKEVKDHGNIFNISIMGGEPTVHPRFEEITLKIHNELMEAGFIKSIIISTNGILPIGDSIQEKTIGGGIIVDGVRRGMSIYATSPESKTHTFRCQFVAPFDTGQKLKDYCEVPDSCGIACNAFGYWPCGAGGSVARLFGLSEYAKYKLPEKVSDFGNLDNLCKFCQVKAQKWMKVADFGSICSRSFKEAFANKTIVLPEY